VARLSGHRHGGPGACAVARYGLTLAQELKEGRTFSGQSRGRSPLAVAEASRSFQEGSVCKLFPFFQVVRGAYLGPRGQDTWQIGAGCRGEAALHKAGIPRVTWCPVADWKVEDWPARTGAAESRTPTPTRTPTSPVATKPHSLRVSR